MNGHPSTTWPIMRTKSLLRIVKRQDERNKENQAPLVSSIKEDEARQVEATKEKQIDQKPGSPQAESIGEIGSHPALVNQIISEHRLLATLDGNEWLFLSSKVPGLPEDKAVALYATLSSSIEGLDRLQRLHGIVVSLRIGLLNSSCWAPCCSLLENYWHQFLELTEHPSSCQFLNVFVEFIGKLEIDETWGLVIMKDCISLLKRVTDERVELTIQLLSVLCHRSQAISDQMYEEIVCSYNEARPADTSMSWTTIFLITDFYFSLTQLLPSGCLKPLNITTLTRPLKVLATRLKETSSGGDRSERFLESLARDFRKTKEFSAEWIALICISKVLLSEFVKRPGPSLLKHENSDAWSFLARILRSCERKLGDCTIETFMARDIRFTTLPKSSLLAVQSLQRLLESLSAPAETRMSSALSMFGANSDRYFAVILKLMGDNSASVRVRAIRGLSKLIDPDDQISRNQNFMKALSNRFEDPSPLVRDAALDFYFFLHKIKDQESAMLALSKLDDPSPLVRRRIIRVIESQIGISTLDPSVSSELRAALINEVSTEERVLADFSFNALLNSWLLPFFHKRSELLAKGESIPLRQTMADLTAEIIKTIRSSRTSIVAFQAFSARVRETTRGEEWSLVCQEIVDLLFETLVSSVESGNDSAVKFILAAIVVFTADSVDCVRAHFKLICRLMLSNEVETVEHSLSLLKGFLRELDLTLLRGVPELVKDLCRLSFRGSNIAVRSAIECLGSLAIKDCGALERLRYLISKHQSIAIPRGQTYGTSEDLLRYRSLYSLSMLTRVVHVNNIAVDISPDSIIESLSSICPTDPKGAILCALSCAELLAIPFVAIKPHFISIVKGLLSESCAIAQVSLLRGLLSLLMNSSRSTVKSSFHPCDDRPPDETSALSTVFQVYFSDLQRLILEGDTKVDEVIIAIFAAALSNGLIPPQALIPYLFCAWHPSNPRIQQKVAFQCANLTRKFEPYLMLVLRQVFKLTYQYLCKTGTSYHLFCSADGATESYFHELFECLSTRSKRIEFLSSLMQEVECQPCVNNYLVFLLVSIAQLPFKSDEEILSVLRRVDEQIATGDGDLDAELPQPQQIRQLLILEVKNYIHGSYRIQLQ